MPVFSTPSAAPRPNVVISSRKRSEVAGGSGQNPASDIIESSPESTSSLDNEELEDSGEDVEAVEVSEDEEMRDGDNEPVDAIEVYSSSSPGSPLPSFGLDDEPAPKRRRITASPPVNSPVIHSPGVDTPTRLAMENEIEDDIDPPDNGQSYQLQSDFEDTDSHELYSDDVQDLYNQDNSPVLKFGQSPIDFDPASDDSAHLGPNSPSSSFAGEDDDFATAQDSATGATVPPTFRQPPRFKGVELQVGEQEAERPGQNDVRLPDALFTPQRRGAKYVAGGLAAELRDWLVNIKGGDGGHGDDARSGDVGFATKMVVDELEAAPGMHLVQGRRIDSDDHHDNLLPTMNFILAGDGRLDGLTRPRDVVQDSQVGIAQPSWEVVLDGGTTWLVACDWAVVQ